MMPRQIRLLGVGHAKNVPHDFRVFFVARARKEIPGRIGLTHNKKFLASCLSDPQFGLNGRQGLSSGRASLPVLSRLWSLKFFHVRKASARTVTLFQVEISCTSCKVFRSF